MAGLGADVREVFFAMSIPFFASPEYVNRQTSDEQYIRDLYATFFVREPDAGGLTYWLGELTATQSRSALLNSFLFSAEFSNFMTGLFGTQAIRAEVNMTLDPDLPGPGPPAGRRPAARCGSVTPTGTSGPYFAEEYGLIARAGHKEGLHE